MKGVTRKGKKFFAPTTAANHVKPILRILAILAILVQTIFTLNACSGDDGKSCDALPSATAGGYDIVCGGVIKGTLTRDTVYVATDGAGCTLDEAKKELTCGENKYTFKDGNDGKGCSMEQDGDKGPVIIACEDGGEVTIPICGGEIYSLTAQFCDSREGIAYKFAQIGEQTWMTENLKGGTAIGARFIWEDVIAGGLCPAGWKLPNKADFETLILTFITLNEDGIADAGPWHSGGNGQWWGDGIEEDENGLFISLYISSRDVASVIPTSKESGINAIRCIKIK